MSVNTSTIRTLSAIETGFTLMNDVFPLNVTSAMFISHAPDAHKVEESLNMLQQRHSLLQAGIRKRRDKWVFYRLSPMVPLAFQSSTLEDQDHWRIIVTQFLNMPFDKAGPLLKCWYLPKRDHSEAVIVLSFHHAIVDAVSARLLLHELLCLLGDEPLQAPQFEQKHVFPKAFRGFALIRKLASLLWRQLWEEKHYASRGILFPIPADPTNNVLSIRLTPAVSAALKRKAIQSGVGIHSMLLASLLHLVLQCKATDPNRRLARLVSFADVRGAVQPAAANDAMGCYISMLRLTVEANNNTPVTALAIALQRSLFAAARRKEVLLMSRLSKLLVKTVLKTRNQRLGVAALSYTGKLNLQRHYGSIQLKDVKAFITNNPLGAVLGGYSNELFDGISMDVTLLREEWPEYNIVELEQQLFLMLEKLATDA